MVGKYSVMTLILFSVKMYIMMFDFNNIGKTFLIINDII